MNYVSTGTFSILFLSSLSIRTYLPTYTLPLNKKQKNQQKEKINNG